jgi:hypothetical protein
MLTSGVTGEGGPPQTSRQRHGIIKSPIIDVAATVFVKPGVRSHGWRIRCGATIIHRHAD